MANPYLGLEKPVSDVRPYLARIHCEDISAADLPTLNRLIDSHTKYIPFENLDVYLGGKHPSLETDALFDKLVTRERGGYCFEMNGLFEKCLCAVGYDAFSVGVRIIRDKDYLPPVMHRGVLVRLDGRLYYADVGYGGPAPVTALLLEKEAGWQQSGSRRYRAERNGNEGRIFLENEKGEELLFIFPTEPTLPVDFLGSNLMCSTPPNSMFTKMVVVSRRLEDGHASVNGNVLTVKQGGREEVRTLSEGELPEALKSWFGIVL